MMRLQYYYYYYGAGGSNNSDPELFELNHLFKNRKNLFESFDYLRGFTEFLHEYDKLVLRTLGIKAKVEYELNDVGYGSLKAKLAQFIRDTPDDAIKDLSIKKLIGHYLIKAKYALVKWLEKNKEIESKAQLEKLQTELDKEASVLKEKGLVFPQINLLVLVVLLDKGQAVFQKLVNDEELEYKSDVGSAKLNSRISVNKPKLLIELGQQSYETTVPTVLQLKKIELLDDNPKWTFLQERKSITALISDTVWLQQYHERQIPIFPEDYMKVDLKTIYTVVSPLQRGETTYEIKKVHGVIPPSNLQSELFPQGE